MFEGRARILTVSDDPDAGAPVIAALAGHEVVAVPDLAAAGARIEDGGIELVVVTGDGAPCHELKRHDRDRFLPVLVVVADDGAAHDRAFALGADDVVVAPADPRALQRRVAALVRRQRQELRLRAQLAAAHELRQLQDELARRHVHDLLGPVAGLDGFLRLLQRDPGDVEARAMIDQALRATHDLRELVEDLGRIQGLEDGALTPARQPVRVGALVADAITAVASAAAHRRVTVAVVGDDLEISADPVLLGRALARALARGVRAAPRRTEVTVTIRRDAGAVVLEIVDRGAAAADQLAALVDPHAGGGRFGLYLPALVARLHGGALAAVPHPDGGALVRLTLPGRA